MKHIVKSFLNLKDNKFQARQLIIKSNTSYDNSTTKQEGRKQHAKILEECIEKFNIGDEYDLEVYINDTIQHRSNIILSENELKRIKDNTKVRDHE